MVKIGQSSGDHNKMTSQKNPESSSSATNGANGSALVQALSSRLKGLSRVDAIRTLNTAVGSKGLQALIENKDYVYKNLQIVLMNDSEAKNFAENINQLKTLGIKVYPEILESVPTKDGSNVLIIDNKFHQEDLITIDKAQREKLLDRNEIREYYGFMDKLLKESNLVLKTEFDTEGEPPPVLVFDKKSASIVALNWYSLDKIGSEGQQYWKKAIKSDLESR